MQLFFLRRNGIIPNENASKGDFTVMAENKEYMTRQEDMGSIQISEDVVASIASNAAMEVEGVSGLMGANVSDFMGGKKMTAKGVRVESGSESEIVVNLYISVRYGNAVSEVAKKVQQVVFTALEGMTGFKITAVNVQVGGVTFN